MFADVVEKHAHPRNKDKDQQDAKHVLIWCFQSTHVAPCGTTRAQSYADYGINPQHNRDANIAAQANVRV
jgi:hypothetical protein